MRLTACLLSFASAAALSACGGDPAPLPPATDASPPAPAADAAPPPALADAPAASSIQQALARFYSAEASATGPWTTVPNDATLRITNETPGMVTRRVCAQGPGARDGETLVAVCGQLKDFSHPTGGVLDLLIVGGSAERAEAFAVRGIGSMGHPGEVTYHRFGAAQGGFEVVTGFTAQGETTAWRRLFFPHDGRYEEVANMRSLIDTAGDCSGAACDTKAKLTFAMRIDTLNPQLAVYPLDIAEEGRECGRDVARHHTLTFDAGTFRYVVPDSLKRDGCSAPATP